MRRIETSSVHAGRDDFASLGVHASPIDLSTTYPGYDLRAGTASFDALVGGAAHAENPIYVRLHNPTVARTEQAIAELEGTESCVAFGSGMAALTALLLARRVAGSHVLVMRPIYGSADHLLACGTLGLEAEFVTVDQIADKRRDDTALVIVETPANPTLKLVDIRAVVAAASEVPVMVDSTFATPVLQNPAALGARYVLHSATKFLGGHGDLMAGVVCCADVDAMPLRQMRALTGALLHPLGAYLLHRGLATLALRVERAQANAIEIALRLVKHAAVANVYFPGLADHEHSELVGDGANAQMRGPGTLMAMELHGGFETAAATMATIKLITPAVSIGSVDSLIQHPAGLTHRVVDEQTRAAHGITPGQLRLSGGIEHVDDLWSDLDQALTHAMVSVREALRDAA